MSQSLVCAIFHVVFSTKYRRRWIVPELKSRLYAYIGGILRQYRGCLLKCGGTSDHIHSLHQTTSIADSTREIKSKSTGWVHQTFPQHKDFSWQTVYTPFSVGIGEVERVKRYIETQKIHHTKRTFQEELRRLLGTHGLAFDDNAADATIDHQRVPKWLRRADNVSCAPSELTFGGKPGFLGPLSCRADGTTIGTSCGRRIPGVERRGSVGSA